MILIANYPNHIIDVNHNPPQAINRGNKEERIKQTKSIWRKALEGTIIGLSLGVVVIASDLSITGTLISTGAITAALIAVRKRRESLSSLIIEAFVYQSFLATASINTSLMKYFSSTETLVLSGISGITAWGVVELFKRINLPEIPL